MGNLDASGVSIMIEQHVAWFQGPPNGLDDLAVAGRVVQSFHFKPFGLGPGCVLDKERGVVKRQWGCRRGRHQLVRSPDAFFPQEEGTIHG